MQEIQVQSLCREGSLEKEMATRSSILAWRIPWTEEPGGLRSWGCKESDSTYQLNNKIHLHSLQTGKPGMLQSMGSQRAGHD